MTAPLITFLSDFGRDDWFVGVVHGVIHELCPAARVIDLTHEIPLGNVTRAAFVLEAAAPDFPPGTIHLAVVDPGVGTERRPVAARARGQHFVGPDNGLFEWALADVGHRVHEIREPRYQRASVSATFHGRDVFAPVAAHLAMGVRVEQLGPLVTDPTRLPASAPHREGADLVGQVMFFDRFGNALTNLTWIVLEAAFPGVSETSLEVRVAGRSLRGLSRTYGDSPRGTLVALMGSSGRLEIAQVGGDAAARLGLGTGDEVRVTSRTR